MCHAALDTAAWPIVVPRTEWGWKVSMQTQTPCARPGGMHWHTVQLWGAGSAGVCTFAP